MRYPVIEFDQPAGTFLLSAMSANDIINISRADPRKFDAISMETIGGIQREPSRKRIKEIAEYSNTVDATFPTPILLALDPGSYNLDDHYIEITGENIADIVDGQHRVLGLKESKRATEFVIPVVFVLDATEEQKALIFATINGKQTKVPASIVFDLFGVTTSRSPQKTAHEIARAMNSTPNSPWFRRLKMLGKKTPGSLESLSQGTFIKFLLPHISADPVTDMDRIRKKQPPIVYDHCIFNEYFRKDQDSTILKILINVFDSVRETWPLEWGNPAESILTKTTGFSGIMRALPEMVKQGKLVNDLSAEFFWPIFRQALSNMKTKGITLASEHFSSSASGEAQFRDIILEALRSTPLTKSGS
jgi:DGQHR domain-containing protein